MKLSFDSIRDSFWKVYFETDVFEDSKTNYLVDFFKISLKDIQKATRIYPIKDYIEKYKNIYFRRLGSSVDKFLMQDTYFNAYMQTIWEKQEKQKEEWEKEFKEKYPDQAKKEEDKKKFRDETFSRFATDDEIDIDLHNICIFALQKYSTMKEQEEYLQKKLSEKYSIFRERIKQKFYEDIQYKEIKEDLLSSSICPDTICFKYFFETATTDELRQIIKSKKEYIKFFWHIYKKSLNSFSDKFIQLSISNFECFVLLSLQALKITLDKSNYTTIGDFHLSINAFKGMNKFDLLHLKVIVEYLAKNSDAITALNKLHEKDSLLELIALDKHNYSIILKLMFQDTKNLSLYLQHLLHINAPKAMDDFFKLYNSEGRYKSFLLKVKEYLLNKSEKFNKDDNPKINQNKIKLFAQLMKALKKAKDVFDAVPEKYFYQILSDYDEFFSEYETPKGVYTPDIYDDMHRLINSIWNHLQNSKYIEILKELQNSKNKRLLDMAKYTLAKAYENQRNERSYPNSYYKEIFEDEKVKNKQETHIHGDVYGAVHNYGEIKQTFNSYSQDKQSERWYKQWWVISFVIAVIGFGVSYWNFQNLYWAFLIGLIAFAIMLFFNPKRRFFRIGLALISTGSILNIVSFTGKITIPENDVLYGFVNLQGRDFSMQGIILIIASMYLFWIDYKENKSHI